MGDHLVAVPHPIVRSLAARDTLLPTLVDGLHRVRRLGVRARVRRLALLAVVE